MNRRLLESKTDESIWQKREKECQAAYQEISQKKTELTEKQAELSDLLEKEQKRKEQLQNEYYEQRRLHQVSVTRAESLRNLAEQNMKVMETASGKSWRSKSKIQESMVLWQT